MADRSLAVASALIARHDAARVQLRERVLARVLAALRLTGDAWYDDDAVKAAAGRAMTVVRAGQAREASLAVRAMTSHVRAVDPKAAGRAPSPSLPPDLRWRDGSGAQYERPAREYRRLRVQGLDELAAMDAAEQRARDLVEDDLSLAHRWAARQAIVASPSVTAWRRAIRPELSRGGVCGLCIVAADRVYGRGELLPIHGGCHCQVVPVVGSADPGRKLNEVDLERLYAAAGSTDGRALKEVRVAVREHGELGPILREAGDRFRTPRASARKLREVTPEQARTELAVLERTLADLEARAAAGEPVAGPLEFQRERVAVLRDLAA